MLIMLTKFRRTLPLSNISKLGGASSYLFKEQKSNGVGIGKFYFRVVCKFVCSLSLMKDFFRKISLFIRSDVRSHVLAYPVRF